MLTERTSVLKKKGIGANGQFQNMHLAVFPYRVEYLKNVDHKLTFYFEKKYQVIGKINNQIQPGKKGQSISISSSENIIDFRLYSQNNVVYQWSAYHVYDNGEEVFQDSCTINLKDLVSNFIIPLKSTASRSVESLINLRFGNQQLKLKFPRIGIILHINLLVSDDPKNIRYEIQKKYLNDDQQHLPQINLLKADSNKNPESLFKRNNLSAISSNKNNKKSSEQQLSSSIHMLKYQSKKQQSKIPPSSDKVQHKISDMNDLDYAILTEQKIDQNYVVQADDQFMKIKLQIQKIDKKSQIKIQDHQNEPQNLTRQLQVEKQYNQGILKLQSDQVKHEKQDSKLQIEELLQTIEQIKSSKQTLNNGNSQKTPIKTNSLPKLKSLPYVVKQQNRQISQISQPKFTLRKGIVYFIAVLLLTMVGATIAKQFNFKTKKHKRK